MDKEILEGARYCINTFENCFPCLLDCGETSCVQVFAKTIIEQHEKYGWHDLRKDPTDLPNPIDDFKLYEVYDKYAHVEYRTVRGWWIKDRISKLKMYYGTGERFADAWREIEPVEPIENEA